MLYYTYSLNGHIKATYNGRLSFIRAENIQMLDWIHSLKAQNDFAQLLGDSTLPSDSQWIQKVLRHEYVHKRLFSESPLGLALIGWRFSTRVRFLLFGDTIEVAKHYTARTIYMMLTQKYQEHVARSVDDLCMGRNIVLSEQIESLIVQTLPALTQTEKEVFHVWKMEHIHPIMPFRFLYRIGGERLHKSYGLVVSSHDQDGQWRENWISDGGVLNELASVRKDESKPRKLQKGILNRLRPEPLTKLQRVKTDLLWFCTGIHAQCQTLRTVFQESEDKIEHRCTLITEFVIQWSGLTEHFSLAYEMVLDASILAPTDFMKKWESTVLGHSDDKRLCKFINFFYLHGN